MKGKTSRPPFLFIDCDGTITEKDTILSIMETFAPPQWIALKEGILAGRISVRKGVGEMFSLLPSGSKGRIIRFVKKESRIRKGFPAFLETCRKQKIEFKVVSGGLDFYLFPLLKEVLPEEDILCNRADFSGPSIGVIWGHPCDPYCHLDCGFCKVSLIRTCDPSLYRRVVIGDSVTDFAAAEAADQVYARDILLERCHESGISAEPFEDFSILKKRFKK